MAVVTFTQLAIPPYEPTYMESAERVREAGPPRVQAALRPACCMANTPWAAERGAAAAGLREESAG